MASRARHSWSAACRQRGIAFGCRHLEASLATTPPRSRRPRRPPAHCRCLDLGRLQQFCGQRRLEQTAPGHCPRHRDRGRDRRAPACRGHKGLARHVQHGIENPAVGDVAGTHLTIDHFLARGRKTGHRQNPRNRSGNRSPFGTIGVKTQYEVRIAQAAIPVLRGPGAAGYSMVTASRAIRRALSSRCSRSCSCTTSAAGPGILHHSCRGHRSERSTGSVQFGLTNRHRINLSRNPAAEGSGRIGSIWRPSHDAGGRADCATRVRRHGDGPGNPLCCSGFPPFPHPYGAGQLVLCNGKSLCYTQARSRTPVRQIPG